MIYCANSSGDIYFKGKLAFLDFSILSGDSKAALKTSCNFCIISFGVPLGATIARAEPNITGYPLSVKVGTSSKPSNLLSVNEANILNSPDLAKLATSLILATVAST